MRGHPNPRSWKCAKKMMLPSCGADTSSRPGKSHFPATDCGQRSPHLMRAPKRTWVTFEHFHDAIAGRRKGIRSSREGRGANGERLRIQQRVDEEGWKMERRGDGRGAKNPNYRRGERKTNRRLNPHDRHDDRVHHVTSPNPIWMCARPAPGSTPRGTRLAMKGPKVPAGRNGYRLKMPRRPIKAQGFVGWPADGFTTAPGHHQSEGWKWMGQLVASTWARKHHGHPTHVRVLTGA
jgi:hypothetical protein